MRSLILLRSAASVRWQVFLVVLSGLALAWLIGHAPIPVVLGALVAIVLCIVFLQRPDLGLLVVLFLRASTDVGLLLVKDVVAVQRGSLSALLSPNSGLILIVILGGGLFVLSRNVPLINLPGGGLLALLLLTGLVGMLRSDSILSSLNEWLPVVSAVVVYALAAHVFWSPRQIQRVINVLAASFVVPALFGFYQLFGGQGFLVRGLDTPRIYGTFVHPNPFGLYLVVILSVFVCQALVQSGKRRLLALLIVAAAIPLLIGTFARFAWLGALVVLLTIGTLRSRLMLVSVPLVALLVAGVVPAIGTRLTDPLGGSFADRVILWQSTIHQWEYVTSLDENPVLIALNRIAGLGPGSVGVLTSRVRGTPYAAHDDYLRIFLEYGFFGLVFFLALTFVLIISAYRTWRRSTDEVMASIALSFVALALAYPVMSITGNVFAATNNQVYFWALAGLTVAISRMSALVDGRSPLAISGSKRESPRAPHARILASRK